MAFFKRFTASVSDEDIICTTEELDQLMEERKKRKKELDEHAANGSTSGEHSGTSS